jgi:membrane protein
MRSVDRFQAWFGDLWHLRWREAFATLRERFAQDRLGVTAGSLTFTTTIALVPMVTVVLAVVTAFPVFSKFQDITQKWLVESLVPDNIARQVLGYLTVFAGKANKLGLAGLVALVLSVLAMIFTIDRTLNAIWRVRTARSLGQRILIYWTAMTVGPLIFGLSVSISSYAISASKGLVVGLPGGVGLLLDLVQFFLVAAVMAAMFQYVPNTHVRWGHAWMGGLFVAVCLEIAKRLLGYYLSKVPTYSVVYGAFATLPILLIWIYIAWVIVLLGATLTAYVPSLLAGAPRRRSGAGSDFQVALEILQALDSVRQTPVKGLTMAGLSGRLALTAQQLEPAVERLVAMDWIGLLSEAQGPQNDARYVLLVDPQNTPARPLLVFLLEPNPATAALWAGAGWERATLRSLL